MITKFIPALLLSAMLTAAAIASARAEVPGEDEGLNAVMAAVEKEHAHTMQAEQQPLTGRAGVPLATRDVAQGKSGC